MSVQYLDFINTFAKLSKIQFSLCSSGVFGTAWWNSWCFYFSMRLQDNNSGNSGNWKGLTTFSIYCNTVYILAVTSRYTFCVCVCFYFYRLWTPRWDGINLASKAKIPFVLLLDAVENMSSRAKRTRFYKSLVMWICSNWWCLLSTAV